MKKRVFALAPIVLAAGLLAAPAAAQPCGPLTFGFASSGPGCAPFGGAIPTLAGALGPVAPAACPVVLTVTAPPAPLPIPIPVFLALGVSNPMTDLGPFGFAGCTLWTSLDVILAVPVVAPPVYSITIPVAPMPVFAGATVYSQAVTVSIGLAGLAPSLTNGLAISL